jgi:hypothetical protein
MMLVEKYANHQPLNRQSEHYAREGIQLSASTLADHVGACAAVLKQLHELIKAHVFAAEERLVLCRKEIAPLVDDLVAWMRRERAKLSHHNEVAKAMDYMLKRIDAFTRFLEDGRICLSNNAAERELRGIAMTESLCAPFSSVCKHWNLILRFEVTRAAFTPHRSNNGLTLKVGGPDLVGRAFDHLFRW